MQRRRQRGRGIDRYRTGITTVELISPKLIVPKEWKQEAECLRPRVLRYIKTLHPFGRFWLENKVHLAITTTGVPTKDDLKVIANRAVSQKTYLSEVSIPAFTTDLFAILVGTFEVAGIRVAVNIDPAEAPSLYPDINVLLNVDYEDLFLIYPYLTISSDKNSVKNQFVELVGWDTTTHWLVVDFTLPFWVREAIKIEATNPLDITLPAKIQIAVRLFDLEEKIEATVFTAGNGITP